MQQASKAHLWAKCALSGALIAGSADGYVSSHCHDADSEKRREGRAAAWLIGEIMREQLSDEIPSHYVGYKAPNNWIVDLEMAFAVCEYIRHVRAVANGMSIMLDTPVNIRDEITGRCAVAAVDHRAQEVHVFGFYYGHRIVEAEENPELLVYGCALALTSPPYGIVLHVYQPRSFHPEGVARRWSTPADEVERHYVDLYWAAHHANAPSPHDAVPGAQCRDCAGRLSCHTLAMATYDAVDRVRDAALVKMTAEQLADELDFLERAADLIKHRKEGIETEAEGRITKGEHIAGWEMVPTTGKRIFTADAAKVQMLTGIYPFSPPEMVTPAELERMGASKAIVKSITVSPPLGRKLKRTSAAAFKRMFGK